MKRQEFIGKKIYYIQHLKQYCNFLRSCSLVCKAIRVVNVLSKQRKIQFFTSNPFEAENHIAKCIHWHFTQYQRQNDLGKCDLGPIKINILHRNKDARLHLYNVKHILMCYAIWLKFNKIPKLGCLDVDEFLKSHFWFLHFFKLWGKNVVCRFSLYCGI